MTNPLTPEEVIERSQRSESRLGSPAKQPRPDTRSQYLPHRPEFYVPAITRRLLNFLTST